MDDAYGARWRRKTDRDDIQVKMGLITEQPQSTPMSRMCLDDATTTDDKQNGDVLPMQLVPLRMLNVPAVPAVSQQEQQFLLE